MPKPSSMQDATGTHDQRQVETGERKLAALSDSAGAQPPWPPEASCCPPTHACAGWRLRSGPARRRRAGCSRPVADCAMALAGRAMKAPIDQRREKLVKSTHELWSPYHRGLASLPFSRKISGPSLAEHVLVPPVPRYCPIQTLVVQPSLGKFARRARICTESRAGCGRNRRVGRDSPRPASSRPKTVTACEPARQALSRSGTSCDPPGPAIESPPWRHARDPRASARGLLGRGPMLLPAARGGRRPALPGRHDGGLRAACPVTWQCCAPVPARAAGRRPRGGARAAGGPPRLGVGRARRCSAAYAAWSYLSIAWAEQKADAWDGANRTALYAVVFALFALWPLGRRGARAARRRARCRDWRDRRGRAAQGGRGRRPAADSSSSGRLAWPRPVPERQRRALVHRRSGPASRWRRAGRCTRCCAGVFLALAVRARRRPRCWPRAAAGCSRCRSS